MLKLRITLWASMFVVCVACLFAAQVVNAQTGSSTALTLIPLASAGVAVIVLYDKVIVNQIATWVALIWPTGLMIGSAPDIRGAAFFNFGIALYLTVLFRARRKS